MRLPPLLVSLTAFGIAAALALAGALSAAQIVERRTAAAVAGALRHDGLDWARATTDGLLVRLEGTAPNEALRFRALNVIGGVVEAGRIRDAIEVTPAQALQAPRFSVELLRNDDGISLIGLVPAGDGPSTLAAEVAALAAGTPVADMLTEADFTPPADWGRALDYGLSALALLPRSKISIAADGVAITAIAGSEAEKRRFETDLARRRPAGIPVSIDISAPRPVLTPFTLRFVRDPGGARFDACAADTEAARDTIIAAAVAAGLEGKAGCVIALGVPTPRWAEAAAAGIAAIGDLDGGTITFSDADVTLLARIETPQATFDRVVGELRAALPEVFSLSATLPEKPASQPPEGPAVFTAQRSPEGRVELRGRLTDEVQSEAATSFAKARFGADAVYVATRLDPDLPDGWPVRVLAGLAALSELHHGTVTVRADLVAVAGVAGSTDAQAAISRILSGQLGPGQAFDVSVTYDERLDPLAALPTPEECVADLNAVLAAGKIAFAPGSTEIEAAAGRTMDALADILRRCPDIPMEIAGHTDSQGSESGNLALSQARAEAVLLGLQGRRVLVGALGAAGYGESRPIADNGTAEGRESNRRIEFSLVGVPASGATAGTSPVPPAGVSPGGTPVPTSVPTSGPTSGLPADVPAGTPLAAVPVEVPVNADPDAAGAQRPRARPVPAAEPPPVVPGFGRPQRGAAAPAPAATTPAPTTSAPTGTAEAPDADAAAAAQPRVTVAAPASVPLGPTAAAPATQAAAAQPARAEVSAAPARAAPAPAAPPAAAPAVPAAPRVVSSSDAPARSVSAASSTSASGGAGSGAASAAGPGGADAAFVSAAPAEKTVRPSERPASP